MNRMYEQYRSRPADFQTNWATRDAVDGTRVNEHVMVRTVRRRQHRTIVQLL